MLSQSAAWTALKSHADEMHAFNMREEFTRDPDRASRFREQACGISLDYSKNRISDTTLALLVDLATQAGVVDKRDAMFRGEKINLTEQRAVLHTALRSPDSSLVFDGENIMRSVHAVLKKIDKFVDSVHSGKHLGYTGKRIENVVNIGIGGSDLGPKMVVTALETGSPNNAPKVHFVSNIDNADFEKVAAQIDPETTLFVIASKTFTTQETMLNANTARDWFVAQTSSKGDVAKHFVAVSTALDKTRAFGIQDDNVFEFWDWVGGRYSLWSAIGLSIALGLGAKQFRDLLSGAHAMDNHFCEAPLERNMPVLMAMLGIWYNNFCDTRQYLVLPYCYSLSEFPSYVQQLDMESNGKSIDIDGNAVDYATGPAVWGGLGSNAQHAFYQLAHQGTQFIPADFIVARDTGNEFHHHPLVANFIAQTQALMRGKRVDEVSAESSLPAEDGLHSHRYFSGNRPTNAIVLESLDARTLGALIALYEHKVFVQGVVWRINSFDQWGVELGKQLAKALEPALAGETESTNLDASTQFLVDVLRA